MQVQANSDGVRRSLSPVEQGLLFHYYYETGSAYVDQMVCDLVGQLDLRHFEEAIERLVARHESLRTYYLRGPGLEMAGVVRESSARRIPFVDLSAEGEARAVVNRHVAADAERRFDLSKQVSRCVLYRLEERLHIFAWTYHHLVADSWTLRLLQEQFCAIYRALLEGEATNDPGATPYTAYVDWIADQDRRSVLNSWATYLRRFTSRRVQHVAVTGTCSDRISLCLRLPQRIRNEVDHVRRQCKVTTNVVLLAMWGVLVLDQQQTSDCLLGCVVFGRSIPLRGVETVAGVCANTVPIVIDGTGLIRELLSELQRDVFGADARSYLAISDVLACAALNHRDLHSVVNFTIDERTVRNKHVDHLPFTITNVRYMQAANFDAYLDIEVDDTGIEITINFDPARRYYVASEVAHKCEQIVQWFVEHADGPVRDLLDALVVAPGPLDVGFAFDAPSSEGRSG